MTRSLSSAEATQIPWVPWFLYLAFFISGANGLVLEIVFTRQLYLSIGVTHYSVGIVLSIYMAGLGIGSYLFGRLADRTNSWLLLYGLLEVAVGMVAVLLTRLSWSLDVFYVFLHQFLGPGQTGQTGIMTKTIIGGLLLLPVTVLMGGTLPALAKLFRSSGRGAGRTVGFLYGLNTIGGVAGTLAATFFFLDWLGSTRTLVAFAILNAGIGLVAVLISVYERAPAADARGSVSGDATGRRVTRGTPAPAGRDSVQGADSILVLLAFFSSGFLGLSLEVYWTRILVYVIGSHGFAFGVTLAAFLSGIGLGSLLFSRVADRVGRPMLWCGLLLLVAVASSFVISEVVYSLRGLAGELTLRLDGSWYEFIVAELLIVFGLLVVPTTLMGGIFPFVMRSLEGDFTVFGSRVGLAYFLNTMGSILGSAVAAFVMIGLAGIPLSIRLTLVAVAVVAAVLIVRALDRSTLRLLAGGVAAAAVAVGAAAPLGDPLQQLEPSERLIFYEEAAAGTVSVREAPNGRRMLSINGLDEVPVDPSSLLTFRVLGHLPLLMHPDPQEVMVLSLGGGITTGSVSTHPVQRIDAVELVPPVVEAARYFERWNHSVLDHQALDVIIQDGRNHLLLTDREYDVITADATHPWSADSWILYTREFYELAKSRLALDGLFCQWVPLHYLSDADFRSILRTMHAAFPDVTVWLTGSYLVAVGATEEAGFDFERIRERMREPAVQADLASVGIGDPVDLASLLLMDAGMLERFVGDGPLNTDDKPYLEHSAARSYGMETTPLNLARLLDYRVRPATYFTESAAGVSDGGIERLRALYDARTEFIEGRIATYAGDFRESLERYEQAMEIAPGDGVSALFHDDARYTLAADTAHLADARRRAGDPAGALEHYETSLELDPGQPRALNGMGLLYYDAGRYAEALRLFDLALVSTENHVQVRHNRVLALLRLGRFAEARDEIRSIEQLEQGMKTRVSDRLKEYLAQAKAAGNS